MVTGCSGFIGMHLCESLLHDDCEVMGIDNMNNYYDLQLKEERLKKLMKNKKFEFLKADISFYDDLDSAFKMFKPTTVVNLAAQTGVRYSIKNPHAYIKSNIKGFVNILELCRIYNTENLVYASSSSVYGGNKDYPFSINDNVDKPISIYAATKKSNELMAHTYSHLFKINTTGLRFFTVYGPWGRPDMAMYIFADKISKNEPIPIFNHGNMMRDFTYIDDIIDGIKASIKKKYKYEIFNLGNNKSESLMEMISIIELCLNKKAKYSFMDIQPGDVKKTVADIDHSKKKLGFSPKISLKEGIYNFINWYKAYSKN